MENTLENILSILSFSKYLLSAKNVLGTVLVAED